MIFPNFVGPSYTSQSPIQSIDECINFYVEKMETEGAKSSMALYPTEGLTSLASSSLSPNRGMYEQDGRAFVVIGFGFFEQLENGTLILRGTIDADQYPATMCSSGDAGLQVMITSGGKVYIYNLQTNAFQIVIGVQARMGGYLDGFFVVLDTVNSTIRISDYLNGLIWNPLQFRVRSAGSDKWVGMLIAHREIWLFGSQTYEVWTNTGSSPFPFNPIPNIFYNQGLGAPFSLAQVGEQAAWLSLNKEGHGMVLMANQYSPIRISNHAVEFAIQGYKDAGFDITDAQSMVYQNQGHTFFVLTFLSANVTWVYDLSTNMWHKRLFWNSGPQEPAHYDAWRPLYHMFAFGKHVVGDRASGQIYNMSISNMYDADGAVIRRLRRAPHVFNERKHVYYRRLELDMQVGIGNNTGLGLDPKVMMRYSNNGGRTYGNEISQSAGKQGEYFTRVLWNRLGAPRDRVFETSMSDPVPWRITGAYLTAQSGAT